MKTDAVINHISNWLKEYAQQSGAKGYVVGISGGIDSAVTSTLCARTNLPLLCLELPIYQPKKQVSRAWEHIHLLQKNHTKVQAESVDLTPAFDAFLTVVGKPENLEVHQLALANARSRLRMTTLYYYAQLHGFLVAGTGNKIEDFGVGFYTKYGDGGVDVSPIADLMKTEVFELGAALGVPKSILDAKPTDGLWGDDRSDEDQIGATYPELEWAMKAVESGSDLVNITARQKEVLSIYTRRHKANLHKMKPIPFCAISEQLKNG